MTDPTITYYILFLLIIQLAKEIVLDQIGSIQAPDPWKGNTSTMSSGIIHRSPDDGVAYSHTSTEVWVPIGCSTVLA